MERAAAEAGRRAWAGQPGTAKYAAAAVPTGAFARVIGCDVNFSVRLCIRAVFQVLFMTTALDLLFFLLDPPREDFLIF